MNKLSFLLAAAVLIFTGCSGKNNTGAAIQAFSGDVTVNGVKLTAPGRAVRFGDKIISGSESFCEIVIQEKNIFKLGADSAITFNISDTEKSFLLEKGWFAGISRRKFTKSNDYIIKSPTVVASVRGTSFCAKVESPDKTYFCVCNGSIELKGDDKTASEKVTAARHAARRFTKNKNGGIIIDANPGLLYHTDEGLEALSSKIGEKIDWTKPDIH